MGLFSGKCPPGGPKWSPNGARMVARTWFLRFSWNLVSVQFYISFGRSSAFSRPRPAPGTSFFVVLLRPPKKTHIFEFFCDLCLFVGPGTGGNNSLFRSFLYSFSFLQNVETCKPSSTSVENRVSEGLFVDHPFFVIKISFFRNMQAAQYILQSGSEKTLKKCTVSLALLFFRKDTAVDARGP